MFLCSSPSLHTAVASSCSIHEMVLIAARDARPPCQTNRLLILFFKFLGTMADLWD